MVLSLLILTCFTSGSIMLIGATPSELDKRASSYVRGCFFTNWAQYRPDKGKYVPEDYVPGMCTHIFYAFAIMTENFELKSFEWNDEDTDSSPGLYHRLLNIKQHQPNLKLILSFGGWKFSHDDQPALVSSMASTPKNRATFIKSVISFLRRINYDGIDIDWEYPGPSDKSNYAALIRETRAAFDDEAKKGGKARLLLTISVASGVPRIDAGYDGQELGKYVDFVNVMSYDYHGSWEQKTGFNSPLYDFQSDQLSISTSMEYWNKIGVPKNKLLVGLSGYGRGWILTDEKNNGVGVPSAGASPALPYTREASIASYYEICDLIDQNEFKEYYDNNQQSAYVVGTQDGRPLWFGYDNVKSLNAKLDWIKQHGYAGTFFFALDHDDFKGQCRSSGGRKYPLLNAINAKLGGTVQPPTSKPDPTPAPNPVPTSTAAPVPPSATAKPNGSIKCEKDGTIFANPQSCDSFFICDHMKPVKMFCPTDLKFNEAMKYCDWPDNANCKRP